MTTAAPARPRTPGAGRCHAGQGTVSSPRRHRAGPSRTDSPSARSRATVASQRCRAPNGVAEDIADCVAWVATRPQHVNVDRLVVRPIAQAAQHKVAREQS